MLAGTFFPSPRAPRLAVAAGFAAIVALQGCTTVPSRPPASPEQLWEQRREQLVELDRWRIEGRIGFISEAESGSASLYWEQHGRRYELRVVAPLGQGTLAVEGGPEGVTLKTDEGEVLQAEDAEYLIWRRTGWVIPVANLRHWILGMPAAGASPDSYTLDAKGRIERLHSHDWTVEYAGYHPLDSMDELMLPSKVRLKGADRQIKVAVRRWIFF